MLYAADVAAHGSTEPPVCPELFSLSYIDASPAERGKTAQRVLQWKPSTSLRLLRLEGVAAEADRRQHIVEALARDLDGVLLTQAHAVMLCKPDEHLVLIDDDKQDGK